MSGAPTADLGEAREINNAGIVVGLFEATVLDDPQAPSYSDGVPWYWNVATYNGTTMTNGALASTAGAANAINDASPAMVAGYLVANSGSWVFDAFRVTVAPPAGFTLLTPPGSDDGARAHHVTNPPSSGTARLVGGSQSSGAFVCAEGDDAVAWPATSVAPAQLVEDTATPNNFVAWGAEALTANPQGQSAGTRCVSAGFSGCDRGAVFWEANGTPVEVGLIAPLTTSDATRVNGMTSADSSGGSVLLVGANAAVASGAVLWWRSLATQQFEVSGIADLVIPAADLQNLIAVTEFVDVNELGWILGNAEFNSTPSLRHAVLLIPDPCGGDFDLDGDVDAADLAVLLGAWGGCPQAGQFCASDLDHDGTVGASDLAILLGMWGICTVDMACNATPCATENGFGGGGPAAMSQSLSGPSATLAAACSAIGFGSLAAYQAWLNEATPDESLAAGAALLAALEVVAQNGGSDQ